MVEETRMKWAQLACLTDTLSAGQQPKVAPVAEMMSAILL
jgi:hypothetical protein